MPSKLTNFVIEDAPDGAIGFDVNHPLSSAQAKAAFKSGFSFCIRYVPRLELSLEPVGDPDITFNEAERILDSGLALFLVQHVSNPGWSANGIKGARFGKNAAIYANECGFPRGVNIFLDLEEVSSASSPSQIEDFCNEWFDALSMSGYEPGIYVGSKNGLNAAQLFTSTKFAHYWHAASQADPPTPRPSDRGYQVFQPLHLTSAQFGKLNHVTLVDKIGLGGTHPAFEIDLKVGTEIIKDVDLDFTVTDRKGGNAKWIKRK
jgi:Domain of unknown function (DUF1906)